MRGKRRDLQIPYGVSDFRRIRNEGYYYVDKTQYLAQLERYAKDRKVPSLAKGTTLHLILVQYRGPKMANCELVGEMRF